AARNHLDPAVVDDIQLGCVTQVGDQGANIAKISALYAGWPASVSGATVNRFCASGLDAVANAAARVHAGIHGMAVAGGVESMSRVPMLSDDGAWFHDPEVAARTEFIHMGISADLIATQLGLTRTELDEFAVRSHRLAAAATEAGAFARSLVPVLGSDGEVVLDRDERIRPELTCEALAARGPAFAAMLHGPTKELVAAKYPELLPVAHHHHSGNGPGMVDGAALLLLGSPEAGRACGLQPRARIRGFATASVEPVLMLTAPAPATRKALAHAGLQVADIDSFEINESFSAPVIACQRALGIEMGRVNNWGGAIAMGHPLGATGAVLILTLLDRLEREDQQFGVVTMCAGAGLGAALVIERV
ncbi:MAG: acetyl-CoA C-acyltransferase, partial [Nannocystaceae bacterium]